MILLFMMKMHWFGEKTKLSLRMINQVFYTVNLVLKMEFIAMDSILFKNLLEEPRTFNELINMRFIDFISVEILKID